jgi:glycosyltransferase involved in cell wall biosynthesis
VRCSSAPRPQGTAGLKIVYFYQYFGTTNGSWSTRVYEFARRWIQAGHRVTVVTSVYDKSDLRPGRWLTRYQIEGIDVRVINVRLSNKHGFLTRIWSFALFSVLACWYALVLPADVVVASSGPITVGLPGLVARYLRRKRLVFEVRDLWPEGAIQLGVLRNRWVIAWARRFERRCYRAASRVVVLSEGMAAWIRQMGVTGKIAVVPNVSNNALFGTQTLSTNVLSLPDWTRGQHIVLYAGSMGLMDDCRQILEMATELKLRGRTSIAVVLIGDGKDRPALQQTARDAALDNVHFLGLKPKTELASWLARARCALLAFQPVPAMDTVSPNKMFDAFAAGVPVVQATQGWIKELLEREQCGLTVPRRDPAAMARAVERLIDDDDLHRKLSQNARRVANTLFDSARLADEMEAVIVAAARDGKSG